MSEYTSTREGFQRLMEMSLTGTPEETKQLVEATTTPDFFQTMNNKRMARDDYIKDTEHWRGKVSEYKPVLHEFLRDGDRVAARMDGTIKVDDTVTYFESFMFVKVDEKSGKMEWLVERTVWGPKDGALEHGTNMNYD